MLRPSILLIACGLAVTLGAADPPETRELTTDLTVRYVDNEVITLSDIHRRMQLIALDRRRRGEPDLTRSEAETLSGVILEELTDEILLLEEADKLGVVVDTEAIKRQVQEEAKTAGDHTIEVQVAKRKQRVREQKIRFVVQHHLSLWPSVRPSDIRAAYEADPDRYATPPRAKCRRILLDVATEAERAASDDQLLLCFRAVQSDPHLKDTVTDKDLAAILAAKGDAKFDLIVAALKAARAQAAEDPPPATAQLLGAIGASLETRALLRSHEDARASLAAMRERLVAIQDEAQRRAVFTDLAAQHDDSGNGGDLGWVEPTVKSEAFDAQAFSLAPGEVSPVYFDGPAACLLLVEQREEGGRRTLADVSGVIKAELEAGRRKAASDALMARLRHEANITDTPAVQRLAEPDKE